MEIRHLRYFLAVAEDLSFRRAAKRLNISQPPLSLQIQQLEHELGSKLFDRNHQRVALTAPGRALLDHAHRVMATIQAAKAAVNMAATGEGGELRIGFTPSTEFQPFLSNAIRRFREARPSVSLKLHEMTSAAQIEALERRELDIGIGRKPLDRRSMRLTLIEIFRDSLIVAVPDSYELAGSEGLRVADLRNTPFVCLSQDSGTGLRACIFDLCSDNGFTPAIVQEARELPTVIALVAAGLGIAIVPAAVSCIVSDGVHYVKLLESLAPSLYLIHNEDEKTNIKEYFNLLLQEECD